MPSRLLSGRSGLNAVDITAIVPTFRRPTRLVDAVRALSRSTTGWASRFE